MSCATLLPAFPSIGQALTIACPMSATFPEVCKLVVHTITGKFGGGGAAEDILSKIPVLAQGVGLIWCTSPKLEFKSTAFALASGIPTGLLVSGCCRA